MRIVVLVLSAVWLAAFAATGGSQREKSADPPVEPALVRALSEEGATLFDADCAACHASEVGESVGPTMTGNPALGSKDHVIKRILEGMPAKGMPPFATSYTDRKVAAVSTFIRGSFENTFGPVVEADVRRVREAAKNADRTNLAPTVWSDAVDSSRDTPPSTK